MVTKNTTADPVSLDAAKAKIRSYEPIEARRILTALIAEERDEAEAWLLLANIADTPEQQRTYLNRALRLKPKSELVKVNLQPTGTSYSPPSRHAANRQPVVLVESKEVSNGSASVEGNTDSKRGDRLRVVWSAFKKPARAGDDLRAPSASDDVSSGSTTIASKSLDIERQSETAALHLKDNGATNQRIVETVPHLYKATFPDMSAATATATLPLQRSGLSWLGQIGEEKNSLLVAIAYLAALTIAEVCTVFLSVSAGVVMHLILLLLILAHATRRLAFPDHRLWISLALTPLIRIISLSLPLSNFGLSYWFLYTSIPLFAAAIMIKRLLKVSWRDVGLTTRGLPLQFLIGLLGFGLGYMEYVILKPEPLIGEFTLQQLWWPMLILFVSTGLLEELTFRGIMQGTAVEQLGSARGIIYVAALFAVLHIGYKSLADVIFVFGVGVVFGWIVYKTRSIVGVTIAHGFTNTFLFLIMPFVSAGSIF